MASWSSKSIIAYVLLAVASVTISVLIFLPASWLGAILDKQTQGRLSLGDVQGSFWKGSAFFGVAADKQGAVMALFPGRFTWTISPKLLLGQVEAEIHNDDALSKPIRVSGNFTEWQFSPSSIRLPSERLEGLGAPLNTIGPTGKVSLSWDQLQFARNGQQVSVNGQLVLDLNEMASRASSIRPLGSYSVVFKLMQDRVDLNLSTVRGPMMLEGGGALIQGRLQFSGKAYAQQGQEEKLANLLNLLGRRRQEGDKQVIALEYK